MNKSYYEILGVEKNVTPAELKKAYRVLAKKYHPDISKEPDAEERFQEIAHAYDVLSDEEKKAHYDRYGTNPDDFSNRYQSGNYYSGVNQADIQFRKFSELSLLTRILLILLIIIGIIYLIVKLIMSIFRRRG